MNNITPNHSLKAFLKHLLGLTLFLFLSQNARTGESSTNWNWAHFALNIPQQKLILNDEIHASIVVSNTSEAQHLVRWVADNPCGYGFGEFRILDISSGNIIECRHPPDEHGVVTLTGASHLQDHMSKTFDFNLAAAYTITNAGVYSVQAIGWFPASEPPTNNQYVTVITPPILISLSPKVETNAPPK